jgi:hypothetical protein
VNQIHEIHFRKKRKGKTKKQAQKITTAGKDGEKLEPMPYW